MDELSTRFVNELEQLLGVTVASPEFVEIALTHRSFVNEAGNSGLKDNERLEFLGDAVLNLQVSNILMSRYPDHDEGSLSKFRSAIVNERSLASVARDMNLGKYLRLGKGEELTQGRDKDSILANAFEAVVAALYLSGGEALAFLLVSHYLGDAAVRVTSVSERQDYKTALQEHTQRYLRTTPIYRLAREEGPDHDKWFDSEVVIDDRVYGRGRAKSKKDSEQRAAEEAFSALLREIPNRDES